MLDSERPTLNAMYSSLEIVTISKNKFLNKAYDQALAGQTGIECFDFWVNELKETGYLHNHARMWFASIWIFTLKLPWQQGAAFFLEHLFLVLYVPFLYLGT